MLAAMIILILTGLLRGVRTHHALVLENLALRHQLAVLRRTAARPRLRPCDRLSLAKTPSGGHVVDLSARIRRQSQLDDHHPPPPAPTLPVPLRRSPPARPREPRLAPAARRVPENGHAAEAAQDGSPLLGRAGLDLGRVAGGPRDR